MLLKNIIGQQQTITRLRAAANSGRIPHAQLLIGKEGYGTLALVLAYAQYLSCTNPTDDACGTCPSCRKFARLEHPDLHIIFPYIKPDSKKDYHCDDFIQQLRPLLIADPYTTLQTWLSRTDANKQGLIPANESDAISRTLNLKTYEGRYKIVIIWAIDKMNEICANKFLKTLEEPTPDTIFLLTTEHPETLLPTILSRVQCITLPPIDQPSLIAALQAKYPDTPEDTIQQAAHMSLGNYPVACDLIEGNDENNANLNNYITLMRLAYKQNFLDLKRWSEAFDKNREQVKNFLQYTQHMVRENFIHNLRLPINYMTTEEQQFSDKFSPFINERNVELIIADLQQAILETEQNCATKIILFSIAVHLSKYLRK